MHEEIILNISIWKPRIFAKADCYFLPNNDQWKYCHHQDYWKEIPIYLSCFIFHLFTPKYSPFQTYLSKRGCTLLINLLLYYVAFIALLLFHCDLDPDCFLTGFYSDGCFTFFLCCDHTSATYNRNFLIGRCISYFLFAGRRCNSCYKCQ